MVHLTLTEPHCLPPQSLRHGSPYRRACWPTDTTAPVIRLVSSDDSSRFVPLGLGKSVVIELPRDVKEVLVADP